MALLLGQQGRDDSTQPALFSHLPQGMAQTGRGRLKNAPNQLLQGLLLHHPLLQMPSASGGGPGSQDAEAPQGRASGQSFCTHFQQARVTLLHPCRASP